MAIEVLPYMGNIGELSGILARQATETNLEENCLDVLRREFIWKVKNWPSANRIGGMEERSWFGTLSLSVRSQGGDEALPSSAYERLVAWVDSWEGVVNLISRIRFSKQIFHSERISNRLTDLRCMIREEEGEMADISVDSLRTFFSFLKMHPNIRYPEITLTPDGDIYSRWKGDEGALFSVEFLPDSNVGYVVFASNPRHPGEVSRNSGTDFVDTVFEQINAAFGISAWILE